MRSFQPGALALCALFLVACPSSPDHDAGDAAPRDVITTMDAPPDVPLPNITIDEGYLAQDVQFAMQFFQGSACELQEMCVTGPGWRRLLMFTTYTPNVGEADLNLGTSNSSNPNFEYSTCHMHYHFRGYAEYSLVGGDGGTAATGHKQSFCVEDLEQVDHSPDIRSDSYFTDCGDGNAAQGISRGWADDYYPNLPCQWIDVTDVSPGEYTLRVSINYQHRFAESDYTDNVAEVPVTIPAEWSVGTRGSSNDPTHACGVSDPGQGIGRDCGWQVQGTYQCTPGAHVRVGCSADCGLGSCTGDSLLRVCDGTQPCRGGDATHVLQQDYGECSTGVYQLTGLNCPLAAFDCPASGTFTVLKAPDYDGDSARCNVAIENAVTTPADSGTGDASAD